MKDKIRGGIISLVIGDTLGVPVEFKDRIFLRENPVTGFQEYGTHHQPQGTWSDDSALTLCTLESLVGGIDFKKTMDLFLSWYTEAHWTATGEVFDIGVATAEALRAYQSGNEPLYCGSFDEFSNGNGSLMRILPVSFENNLAKPVDRSNLIFKFSGLTHGHSRSKIACWLYSEIVANILDGKSKSLAVDDAFTNVNDWCLANGLGAEWKHFHRCRSDIVNNEIATIKSSGYVIDSLEASIYCFLKHETIMDALLSAVNLGGDTDSIAAITRGLSGTFYGIDSLDRKWIDGIARAGEIMSLVERYVGYKGIG